MYSVNVFSNNVRVVIICTCFSMVTLYAIGRSISHVHLFQNGSNCVSRIEEENNLYPSSLKTFSQQHTFYISLPISRALESVIICSVKIVRGSYCELYKDSEGIVLLWNCV